MPFRNRFPIVALSTILLSLCVVAQVPATLTVSPNKATMLVGETRTFRAVGKDGRIRPNVRWEISPSYAAEVAINGDEVTVTAREASPSVMLTASVEGDSANASIEIRAAGDMKPGTTLWSVAPTPGCKATQMIQAVPSANGPDLYVQETCPDGTMLRALTSDGRELWRKMLAGTSVGAAVPTSNGPYIGFLPNGPTSPAPSKPAEPAGAHIGHGASVCDAVSPGMTRGDALNAVAEHNVKLDAKQRPRDTWIVEEQGSSCTISFDATTGNVVKKKKTIVTD
ncbi:MAG TPA: hypothetical protein VGS78_01685 [Candidatus Sulfotelmatobacter sp.]|nr:hypothetical protein [Candidatus Sulfotelmatobacter sp.]